MRIRETALSNLDLDLLTFDGIEGDVKNLLFDLGFGHPSVVHGGESDGGVDAALVAGLVLAVQYHIKGIPNKDLILLVQLKLHILNYSYNDTSEILHLTIEI